MNNEKQLYNKCACARFERKVDFLQIGIPPVDFEISHIFIVPKTARQNNRPVRTDIMQNMDLKDRDHKWTLFGLGIC